MKEHFKGVCSGKIEGLEFPNLGVLNFLLCELLGGGGTKSLKDGAQNKTLGSALLRMEIEKKIKN